MSKKLFSLVYMTGLLLFFVPGAEAQFYNGLQMDFGKNRVQYRNYLWNYYRFENYDIYFHREGDRLARLSAHLVQEELANMQEFFGHTLKQRIIFIVYNKHGDFLQNNIGLVSDAENYNIGGKTQIIDNKVFVYYEGDRKKFRKQVRKVIAEVIFNDMLYGGNVSERVANSALINVPEWYSQGLFAYVAEPWNIEMENQLRDGVLTNRYRKFNHLTDQDAKYAGQSLWYYIARTNGPEVIQNIIYMTKINKSVEAGFMYVLGKSTRSLLSDWYKYYKQLYTDQKEDRQAPSGENIISWFRDKRRYQHISLSPDHKHLAYVSHEKGRYKVWVYNTQTGDKKRVFADGHKLDQITDYAFPMFDWHPNNKLLGFFTEEEGMVFLRLYNVQTKEMTRRLVINYTKVLSFDFSPNGREIVVSAISKGQTDLFVFNIPANTSRRLTQDPADDIDPVYIENGKEILFASNRRDDTLRQGEPVTTQVASTFDLFKIPGRGKTNVLKRVTSTPYDNEYNPVEIRKEIYTFLSDKNGIVNRHIAKYDSTISYVDTVVHYRYFTSRYALSNYDRNIEGFAVAPAKLKQANLFYEDEEYQLYFSPLNTGRSAMKGDFSPTRFYKWRKGYIQRQDSTPPSKPTEREKTLQRLSEIDTANIPHPPRYVHPDSLVVDITNYAFEREKYPRFFLKKEAEALADKEEKKNQMPPLGTYRTTFYKDYLVNQVDFGFLNNSYQAFTGGAVFFNPGMTGLFKIGTKDLFEDYRLIAGARFSGDFSSNEFMVSVENLKNRIDKQFIFDRQTFVQNFEDGRTKTRSSNFFYIWKYPFSQVFAAQLTANFRYDKTAVLSETIGTLQQGNTYAAWTGEKAELVFDNTRSLGLNTLEGLRWKVFGEAYQEVDGDYNDLYVVGGDFRYYFPIHRDFIWAFRAAGSTSLGRKRLVYYLGAVDGWINLSSRVPTFDRSVEISQREKYAFQTIATNMRGFSQNVRNGNSFALVNTELRMPLFRYLVDRPMSSDFLNSFQLVGFADAGSAWVGASPWSDKNEFHRTVIENNPITVTLENNTTGLVAGYGLGMRAKVFGYFLRLDYAWGVADYQIYDPVFYLSLSVDF